MKSLIHIVNDIIEQGKNQGITIRARAHFSDWDLWVDEKPSFRVTIESRDFAQCTKQVAEELIESTVDQLLLTATHYRDNNSPESHFKAMIKTIQTQPNETLLGQQLQMYFRKKILPTLDPTLITKYSNENNSL